MQGPKPVVPISLKQWCYAIHGDVFDGQADMTRSKGAAANFIPQMYRRDLVKQ
jgi:hypothetical protein